MSSASVTAISFSLIAVIGLWFVAFHVAADLRADCLRHKLAKLRDDLIDDIDGRQLLLLIESASRSAEHLSFLRLLLQRPIAGIREEVHYSDMHGRMRLVIARHIALGCPLLWPRVVRGVFSRSQDSPWSQASHLLPTIDRLESLLEDRIVRLGERLSDGRCFGSRATE